MTSTDNDTHVFEPKYNGHDGLGDVFTDKPDVSKYLQKEHAAHALHRIVSENKGKRIMKYLLF